MFLKKLLGALAENRLAGCAATKDHQPIPSPLWVQIQIPAPEAVL